MEEKVKRFQREDITLSEVYAEWKDLILIYEDMVYIDEDEPLINALLGNLNKRFNSISDNRLVLSSVYLDPRFQLLLDEDEKTVAKDHLTKLYMYYFHGNTIETLNTIETTTKKYGALESLLRVREKEIQSGTSTTAQASACTTIHQKIVEFDGVKRLNIQENVLMFWEQNKNTYPILYQLSGIVLSVPGTEVTTERNFSILKFVLNRLRTSLSDDELEKILFSKLNKEKH